jgi:Putative zinc-finger
MSCPFGHDDAAYVLGALSPAEHRQFEAHLLTCQECTESLRAIAGLPGLLSKVRVEDIDEPDPDPELADAVLTSLLVRVRRSRRHRIWGMAGLAAAACLAVVAAAVIVLPGSASDSTPPQASVTASGTPVTMTPIGESPIRATVQLADKPWGTTIDLRCSYVPGYSREGVTYTLVVTDQAGTSEQVASWTAVPDGVSTVTGSSAWSRQDIASIQIRTEAGTPVTRLDT